MLTDRQCKVLKLIVEKYIKDPIPVGSKTISKTLKCSSATVRNEMSALEEAELLEKTHTSSGRVPSEKGYKYYGIESNDGLSQYNKEKYTST